MKPLSTQADIKLSNIQILIHFIVESKVPGL